MRKVLSIFLVFSILSIYFSTSAYAVSEENIQRKIDAYQLIIDDLGRDYISAPLVQEVASDLELLEKVYLKEYVSISTVNSDESITYKIPFEQAGFTDYINIAEDGDGNIVMSVKENDKCSELKYMLDGRVLINGNEVVVENDISTKEEKPYVSSFEVQPRAGVHTSVTGIRLDNGAASIDKTKYYYTNTYYSGPRVNLGSALKDIAVSVFITVVVNAVKMGVRAAIGTLSEGTIAEAVLTAGLTLARNDIALLASDATYGNRQYMHMNVFEYARNNNDSFYSEWIYAIDLYLDPEPGKDWNPADYMGAKKIRQAT